MRLLPSICFAFVAAALPWCYAVDPQQDAATLPVQLRKHLLGAIALLT